MGGHKLSYSIRIVALVHCHCVKGLISNLCWKQWSLSQMFHNSLCWTYPGINKCFTFVLIKFQCIWQMSLQNRWFCHIICSLQQNNHMLHSKQTKIKSDVSIVYICGECWLLWPSGLCSLMQGCRIHVCHGSTHMKNSLIHSDHENNGQSRSAYWCELHWGERTWVFFTLTKFYLW
jgi:hypothetical protein